MDHLFFCFFFRKEKPSLILEILQRLSELRRFDMAVMFMSETEKKSEICEQSFSISLFFFSSLYSYIPLLFFKQMIANICWMFTMSKVHAIKFK